MDNARAEAALNGFSHVLNRIEAQKHLSVTDVQGPEMATRHRFTEATGLKVYIDDPQSTWQPGFNKNTNSFCDRTYQMEANRVNTRNKIWTRFSGS